MTDFRCADCKLDTGFGNYYTLHDAAWLEATPDGARMLCVDCLEVRLGRRVTAADFLITPPEMEMRFCAMRQGHLPDNGALDRPFAVRQREFQDWRAFIRWRQP